MEHGLLGISPPHAPHALPRRRPSRRGGEPARAADCPRQGAVKVPGAERQVADCLDDLTTKGTTTNGHTDRSDWQTLHAAATRNPAKVVPGLQVDGYFPDTSTTNSLPRLAARLAVRAPPAQRLERQARRDRRARRPPPVRARLHHRRLRAGQGLRLRLDRQGQLRHELLRGRGAARRRGRGVAPPRHRAHARRQAGGALALRAAAGAHLHDRHLQRRLPDALAAREPPRALRRRRRLGGHADARRRAQPLHLPADRAARVRRLQARRRGRAPALLRRRLRPRLRAAVGRPLHGVLGPHAAQLPRGVRPRLRRRARGRHAVLPAGDARAATPTTTTRRARRRSRTPSAASR